MAQLLGPPVAQLGAAASRAQLGVAQLVMTQLVLVMAQLVLVIAQLVMAQLVLVMAQLSQL